MNSGPTIPLRFAATTADPGERVDHFLSCDSATGSDADRLPNTLTKFAAAESDLGSDAISMMPWGFKRRVAIRLGEG
jgi:hypothetical protein